MYIICATPTEVLAMKKQVAWGLILLSLATTLVAQGEEETNEEKERKNYFKDGIEYRPQEYPVEFRLKPKFKGGSPHRQPGESNALELYFQVDVAF